jgi:hypothetical protein
MVPRKKRLISPFPFPPDENVFSQDKGLLKIAARISDLILTHGRS